MTPQVLDAPAPDATTSPMAIVSLVFGLACWIALPVVGGVVAIVCGHMARRDIRASGGSLTGDGLAVAGLVLGYAQLAAAVIGLLVAVLVLGGIAAVLVALGLMAAAG
jgi:hypothetical protein